VAAYNSLDKFKTQTTSVLSTLFDTVDENSKKTATGNLVTALKGFDFAKSGLNSIPWLGTAVSIIDLFIGGGKKATGPQEVKILPLAANLQVKLNGTITTANQYHDVKFTNPGSKDADLDPDAYPYYNEVMGVFNLLKTPEVWYERDTTQRLTDLFPWLPYQRITVDRFQIDTSSIQWVLNPAAGVQIQNMQVALLTESTFLDSYYEGDSSFYKPMQTSFYFDGIDAITGDRIFRSEYRDVKCAAQRTYRAITQYSTTEPNVYHGFWGSWRPKGDVSGDTTVYLKFLLNLRRTDTVSNTQNVLLVLKFPAKLKGKGMLRYGQDNWSCQDTTLIDPAPASEVNSVCSGSTYNSLSRYSRHYLDSVQALEQTMKGFVLAPNPNKGQFTLSFTKRNTTLSAIEVFDMNGRLVYKSAEGNKSLAYGLVKTLNLNLTTGAYFILAVTPKELLKSKFVVVK
jgi:hypothetical protein